MEDFGQGLNVDRKARKRNRLPHRNFLKKIFGVGKKANKLGRDGKITAMLTQGLCNMAALEQVGIFDSTRRGLT